MSLYEGHHMPNQWVFLADLAEQMGMERSNARKYILDHRFQFTKIRCIAKNNAMMLALSTEDAEAILAQRKQDGFMDGTAAVPETNGHGVFYIVQPMPKLDSTRLKFGFTTSLEQRMLSYHAICPEAIVLYTWPCKSIWEKTAISALSRDACEQLGQELFRCQDIDKILERGQSFFGMLPGP
jgi:hypothetical protein